MKSGDLHFDDPENLSYPAPGPEIKAIMSAPHNIT